MAYGHFRNSGINKINNYAEALKQWEETKPIRRRTTDDRPLGHRRNTWYLIAKRDADDAIECKMYGTPIVTFCKDGRVEVANYSYNTTSTANFIWDVLRNDLTAYIFDHCLIIGVGGHTQGVARVEQRLKRSESLFVKRDDAGNYHFLEHKPEVTHTINRANAKEIRARHTDFMQYLDGMAKLRGVEPFTREELQNQLGKEMYNTDFGRIRYYNHLHSDAGELIDSLKRFKHYITDTSEDRFDGYYKALLMMVHSFGKYDWNSSGFIIRVDSMLRDFDKVLMGLYRDEYFDANVTPSGCAKRDAYGAYFGGIWGLYNSEKA